MTKPIDIPLPQDGRERVKVTIVVGGTTEMDNQEFQTSLGTIRPTITSTGTQRVQVYIDGELVIDTTMDFV